METNIWFTKPNCSWLFWGRYEHYLGSNPKRLDNVRIGTGEIFIAYERDFAPVGRLRQFLTLGSVYSEATKLITSSDVGKSSYLQLDGFAVKSFFADRMSAIPRDDGAFHVQEIFGGFRIFFCGLRPRPGSVFVMRRSFSPP